MKKSVTIVLLVGLALALGFLAGRLGQDRGAGIGSEPSGSAEQAKAEREVLYWVAPMDPNFRRDEPGKSPMGMDLVPVYADEAGSEDGITISPTVQQNFGVRTQAVTERPLWRKIEATAYVGFDETRISHISLRTDGWIVSLAVSAEGERVAEGDLLFEFYSPELVNAQKEYLQALQRGDARLVRGAEEKLRALGMNRPGIDRLSRTGLASENIRILAPQDGVVASLSVREGMYVQPNTPVMELADLSSVWLQADVFEAQAEWVAVGQAAEARLDYLAGEVFSGQVDYVYPVLDPKTRTLRVRLRFDNPSEILKPNMYARVSIFGRLHPNALVVPKEALIRAPDRDRVVIALGDGRFTVREVLPGIESGQWVEIVAGLEIGEEVVTSAQFLIDSEASLAGSIQRLDDDAARREPRFRDDVFASGRVDALDPERRKIRIAHGPIEELAWPSMLMDFDVDPGVSFEGIAAGDLLRFVLRQEQAGQWVISRLAGPEEWLTVSPDEVASMEPEESGEPAPVYGQGEVVSVDPAGGRLRLKHEPIESLGWPGMTMDFRVSEAVNLQGLEGGEVIHFTMKKGSDGRYLIDGIHVMTTGDDTGGHDHD
jgi:Cu(I)/Ag(I) efflux system membrane fusion protein